jgi:predicted XRE-type DNA-binding protein
MGSSLKQDLNEQKSITYKTIASSKRERKMTQEIRVQASSGNVFADLGLENSDQLLVKAELTSKIRRIITQQHMTQAQAAELLGIDQPKVSALINGKLSGFSTVRLFRFLNALGRDVEIVVKTKPKSRSQARTRVVAT